MSDAWSNSTDAKQYEPCRNSDEKPSCAGNCEDLSCWPCSLAKQFQRYGEHVFTIALCVCGDFGGQMEPDELVSRTWLKVVQSPHVRWPAMDDDRGWKRCLSSIVRRLHIDMLREWQRWAAWKDKYEPPTNSQEASLREAALRDALKRCTPNVGRVGELRAIKMSNQEIAVELKLSPQQVREMWAEFKTTVEKTFEDWGISAA
jgi:RNA polymerase sigma factor (sigma-70 family)